MRYRATVAYDGTAYLGFQRQADDAPTIQLALERAIGAATQPPVTVIGAGRTDTGVHALGRQWRIDAGLNADHQLVVWGPYRLVRHPIYTSMLFLLLGTGLVLTPFWLLASRFGAAFLAYRRRAPALIPFSKLPLRAQ